MKPDFIVKAVGKDLTAEFKKRLVSLIVVDGNGLSSDTLTITLDNADKGLAFPEKGTDLQCYLGYEGELNYMGQFRVDDVQVPLHVNTLTIVATGARFRSSYREKRDTSYSDTTLKAIIETVAVRNGFVAKVAGVLGDIPIKHYQQKQLSDSALMVELKEQFGAMIKPVGDKLVAVPDGDGKSVSGKSLPVVDLALSEIELGTVNLTGRNQFHAVRAGYRDFDGGATVWITEGDSAKKVKDLGDGFVDEESARIAIKAKLNEITRKHFTIDVQKMVGNTAIRNKRLVKFVGHYSAKINGEWDVDRATHRLDQNGLVTQWTGKAPKKRGVVSL